MVVLSRSQTGQQVYRWFQLLQQELEAQGAVDAGMLTFVSSDIEGQRTLMKALPNSPLYLTGSREVCYMCLYCLALLRFHILWRFVVKCAVYTCICMRVSASLFSIHHSCFSLTH